MTHHFHFMHCCIKYLLVLYLALCLFPAVSFGQQDKDSQISTHIKTLENVWLKYKNIAVEKPAAGYLSAAKNVFSNNRDDQAFSEAALNKALKKAQAYRLANNPGMEFSAGYSTNYNNGEIEEDNINYHQRMLVGFDWNLLRNGLLDNRLKSERLQNEAVIIDLESSRKVFDKDISSRYSQLLYRFNKEKIQLLEKRKQIVDEKQSAMNRLMQLNALTQLQLIKVNQSVADINGMMHLYRTYNELYEMKNGNDSLQTAILPLIDLNFDEIFKASNGLNNSQDSILKLQEINTNLENSWLSRVGLRASVRYNYYDITSSEKARDFFSAGIGVSIPISTGSGLIKREKLAQSELDKAKFNKSDGEIFSEQLSYYYEFRYKLMQYLNASEKINELKEMLRIERLRQQYHDAEFNPVHALDLLDQLLSMRVDMVDMKQQMYLKLLRLAAYNTDVNISDHLKIISVDSLEMAFNDYFLKKSIYVWSSSVEAITPQYIAEFLSKKGIDRAIVAVKQSDITGTDYNDLARLLKGYNINVSVLMGNNQLVNKTKTELLAFLEATLLKLGKQNMQAIHLDVEPHTLPDYKTKEAIYMQKFTAMITVVKQFCVKNNLQLEVSVPLYYSADVYKKLYTDCNRVYLMSYEQKNIETLSRKIAAIVGDNNIRTTIALRTEDFSNGSELDNFEKQLSDKTGINSFAIHDLQRLLRMEKASAE